MFEVEVKVRADEEAVREALGQTDAVEDSIVAHVDTYYDAPHRAFAETEEAIRVRREAPVEGVDGGSESVIRDAVAEQPVGWLTYKGPLLEAESKTREEVETEVGDVEAMDRILERVGFRAAGEVRKLRRQYKWRGFHLSLDTVVDLGTFLEVEATTEEQEIPATREQALSLLGELGLEPSEQLRTSYFELLHDDP